MFQICLGIAWGQPATPEAMTYMRNLLPAGCTWFAFGISLHQFPMAAQAVLLGGHVRVGLEDNLYLERGKLTPSNAALVAKAAKIIELLGPERRDAGRGAPDARARRACACRDQGCGVTQRIDAEPAASLSGARNLPRWRCPPPRRIIPTAPSA